MNFADILKDLEKLSKNFGSLTNDIESIKNIDLEQANIIQDVVKQITVIKDEVKNITESSKDADDSLLESIFNLTKKIEGLVDIESFEKEIEKIKKVESHLVSIIAQSEVVKALETAFKISQAEAAKNKEETDKKIAENTAEIRDLKYKDEETDYKIKNLDDKIEKAKLGNAKVDSEQSEHITKNTETIASLDKRIIELNKKVDGTISRISMLDSEIEKYHKVNILPKILVGLGIEIIRFGVYFGLITLILNRIA